MQSVFSSIPALGSMVIFLLIYVLVVASAFRRKEGRRRRWHFLDYIWVPLGGLTGICLLALLWRTLVPL